jgi:sugar phosphate isomerase/epimerase
MVRLELTAITDEFSQEFDEVCEYLASQDFHYVELRQVWLGNIVEIDDTVVGDAKDILESNGLKVASLGGPLLKCNPPTLNPNPKSEANYTTNWEYNMSKIDRLLDLAKIFDCKHIRIFGYQGKFETPPVKDWDTWSIWHEWLDATKTLKQKLHNTQKMLIAENDSGLLTSLDEIVKVAESVTSPELGLLLDPGNIAKIYGSQGIISPKWLAQYGPYVQYIHAKDVHEPSPGKFEYTVPNAPDGMCGWKQIIDWFKMADPSIFKYSAPDPLFISIETHMGKQNTWENSKKSMENLKKLIQN